MKAAPCDSIEAIRSRISSAAVRAGRRPEEVLLIAVTKTVEAEAIKQAVQCGVTVFGENRVQEAQGKILKLRSENTPPRAALAEGEIGGGLCWHLIGHLQKNKAKTAVDLFDVIQSVDSVELAETLDRHAGKAGKLQRILLQVKLSDEESKYGISKDNCMSFVDRSLDMKHLKLEGLMTIPPFFDDPERARPYFRGLRKIRQEIAAAGLVLPELSMGMSGDFEVAIEEGATMVRIGTALFGRRKGKEAV
jgi:pyridoxal phosphate enzyme (YggS family)